MKEKVSYSGLNFLKNINLKDLLYKLIRLLLVCIISLYIFIEIKTIKNNIALLSVLNEMKLQKLIQIYNENNSKIQWLIETQILLLQEQIKDNREIKELKKELLNIIIERKKENSKKVDYEKLKKINHYIYNSTDRSAGSGSLITIKNKLYILTASHLINNDSDKLICRIDEKDLNIPLKLIKIDRRNDLALLEIDIVSDDYIEISDIEPENGKLVYAIGNPAGLQDVLTEGIIAKRYYGVYVITAPIYFGNSGGALVCENKLIGVVKQILQVEINRIGICYGVVVDLKTIKKFLEDI